MNFLNIEKLLNLENVNLQLLPQELLEQVKPYVHYLYAETTELIKSKKNENLAKTLLIYHNLMKKLGNEKSFDFPIKFGIPVFEKIQLEDDEYLQKEWAKLLVAAGKEYNSIHLQYKDILSQIGREEARWLKEIYMFQKNHLGFNTEKVYKIQLESLFENKIRTEIQNALEIDVLTVTNWKGDEWEKAHDVEIRGLTNFNDEPQFDYLYKVYKNIDSAEEIYVIQNLLSPQKMASFESLKNLKLINGEFLHEDSMPNYIEDRKTQLRIYLTEFGYNFIEALENIENPI